MSIVSGNFPGITGPRGLTGFEGTTGLIGNTGIVGLTGIYGLTGILGLTGVYGLTGVFGLTGLRGITGFEGNTGIRGVTGTVGLTGVFGLTGFYGLTGVFGLTGFYGQTGIRGTTGVQGVTGISFFDETIVTATADTTTTSTSFVLVGSMTLTPAAGTYAVWFSGSAGNSVSNNTTSMSIYSGGALVAASDRDIVRIGQTNHRVPFCCVVTTTVNGSQAIEGRWLVSGGTGTMQERTLLIVRVG